ncbi:hypothetical protein [Marinomonas gallaica]|uniref:hypothetical protein n=1 Tax=Marinomonas gallaica TaxID=1806667 RepID=UPI003A94A6D8
MSTKEFSDFELSTFESLIQSDEPTERLTALIIAQIVGSNNYGEVSKLIDTLDDIRPIIIERMKDRGLGPEALLVDLLVSSLKTTSVHGPLSRRAKTQQNRESSDSKYESFRAQYIQNMREVVDGFKDGSRRVDVLREFQGKYGSGGSEKDKYPKDLLTEVENEKGKTFISKNGRPRKNQDSVFENFVINHVIQSPRDGYTEICKHMKRAQPRPYQGSLSDAEIIKKIKSVLGERLRSRDGREEYASRK